MNEVLVDGLGDAEGKALLSTYKTSTYNSILTAAHKIITSHVL